MRGRPAVEGVLGRILHSCALPFKTLCKVAPALQKRAALLQISAWSSCDEVSAGVLRAAEVLQAPMANEPPFNLGNMHLTFRIGISL